MLPPFGLQAVFTQWQAAPAVTVSVVLLAGLYLWGVIRVARRHPARPWAASRTVTFLAGLAVIVLALQSGIGSYDDVLFWDHMVQHLMLIMVAPPLLIVGQPITLLLHASRNPLHTWVKKIIRSRVVTFLTWPVFGFAAYAATIVVLHLTGLASLVADNQVAHDGEHVLFIVVGYLFFLPIVGSEPIRWRLSYPAKLILLFLIMPVDTFTGLVLSYGNPGTPGIVTGPRPAWAGSAVGDLHAAGAAMWVAGDGLMFAMMMFVFLLWATDSRARIHSRGWLEAARRATVAPSAPAAATDIDDDDAQLAAYNEYLNRLSQPGQRQQT
ncbi:MAG: cytochrome c oxidase assembly protein [Streptosporangiaceae bacterium]